MTGIQVRGNSFTLNGTGPYDSFNLPLGGVTIDKDSANGSGAVAFTLTDAANITPNAGMTDSFVVTIAGNRTMVNPTNLMKGQRLVFTVIQGTGGSRLITWGTFFKWPAATAPTLSTAVGSKDKIICDADTTTTLLCSATLDVR